MKVTFIIKNAKELNNTIHIRVRNGRKTDLFLDSKIKVDLADWNTNEGKLLEKYQAYRNGKMITLNDAETKQKINNNKDANYRLLDIKKIIEKDFLEDPNKIHNSKWLKELVFPTPIIEENKKITFSEYTGIFQRQKGRDISKHYISKVSTIKKIVEKYQKKRGITNLYLEDINIDFKVDFEKFFIDEEHFNPNYFERTFKFIKTILYHAHDNGNNIYNGLQRLSGKTNPITFQILPEDELQVIADKSFTNDNLDITRDWLLISCYTGQRISDFMRFNTDMIVEKEVEGRKALFIEFTQKKTKAHVLFPIDSRVKKILEKRNWNFPPKISEQGYNRLVKEVCKQVGLTDMVEGSLYLDQYGNERDSSNKNKKSIFRKKNGKFEKWKLITSHTGRRSFASNNYGIIPTALILRVTGHKNEKMLLNYIGKIEERQSLELVKYIK